MSSTYSPDLRIELIGTGDQAGVWGSTTNNNLGTFIENAVAGYTSVSIIASPQALTANDGAADEARFAAIALTTTTAANFTVCIPPNSKLYTFYNASAYIATISNSTVKNGVTLSGGTTIAIPAGKTMSVWSDGTNVAQQTDNLISPALTGTPTAPTASAGTSTTQLATTAFMATMYPVGSIYTSTVSTNPGTLFGFGTWVAFGAGRVLLGVGTNGGQTFANGDTGGTYAPNLLSHTHAGITVGESNTHTHGVSGTVDSAGAHSHGLVDQNGTPTGVTAYQAGSFKAAISGNSANVAYSTDVQGTHTHTFSATSGTESANHTHNFTTEAASSGSQSVGNMQPYVTVYMWNRTF